MRRHYLNPLFSSLRAGLVTAAAAGQAYALLEKGIQTWIAQPAEGIPTGEIQAQLDKMNRYHRNRLIQTFRSALGVNISQVLLEAPIAIFMRLKIDENVDLIRTIPSRLHDGLKKRFAEELQENAFDQQKLMKMFRDEYQSQGYNLRRITRDQTTKTIGNLTEIRQRQLGIDGYKWQTSEDERVRASHRALNGQFFRWDSPPSEGHPGADIQCRCVAIPAVTAADRKRLKKLG